MAKNLTVRAQALGGAWETIGVDRARGVWPENFSASSDSWGATTASFDLRRDSAVPWPDVSAFTPVEVEEDGIVIWEGRVKETPARDGADGQVLNVQCEGWQYHLDDDMYQTTYLHTNLSDWVDTRTLPSQDLTAFQTIGKTQTGAGALSLGWAKDDNIPIGCHVGLTLDFGAFSTISNVAFDVEKIGGGSSGFLNVVIRGHDIDNAIPPATQYEDPYIADTSTITSPSTITAAFTTPRRYVTILTYNKLGSSFGFTADYTLTLKGARVASNTAYLVSGVSNLQADMVIDDALQTTCPLLSTDQTQIDPGATIKFKIPSLAPDGPKTAREMWTGVNAYHGYRSRIALGRIAVFTPQPSAPIIEVGKGIGDGAVEFQDASSNSGEEIYNRVYATAQGADGLPIAINHTRMSTTDLLDQATQTIANPSFATNTASWSVDGGTLTRDTTDFDTTPASGNWANTGRGILSTFMTGTTVIGTTYVAQFAIKATGSFALDVTFGSGPVRSTLHFNPPPSTWTTYRIAWKADRADPGMNLVFTKGPNGTNLRVDSVTVGTIRPTLVDRRGFVRTYQLQVASNMPSDGIAMRQIADVWLDNHKTTPFRGSLTVTGDRTVRDIATGTYLSPAALLDMTGELVRMSDRIDPDTGGFGRDGVIAAVSYDAAANRANLTLDSSRDNLQNLLNRLAAINP